jgi:UPF0755 protein
VTGSPDDTSPRPPQPSSGRSATPTRRRPSAAWADLEPSFTGDDPLFAGRRGTRHSRPGQRRRRFLGYLLVALFALILGLGTGYARGYFASGDLGRRVTVVVPVGATLSSIAAQLEAKGVVKHARAFVIHAESDGYATKFMPGTYTFHQNEPYEELVALLARGVDPPTVKVSIPEGTTLKQAGGLVAAEVGTITAADYVAVARDDPPPFRLGGYKPGTTLEGMLFPATYEVIPKVKARAFVEKQLTAFSENFAKVDMIRALKVNLTPYDVVTIASMIDREALVPAERPMVAAVIWNRLRADMLLQIDATIQYALGKTKPVLTYDDLKIDSPYNTYKHPGLPPTPISNPGLAALQAAAAPADVDYLYYVARNDGTGRHYFSREYAQFLVDLEKAKANAQ